MRDWRPRAARLCGGLAAVALAGMMLLTVADVGLRALVNLPIRGILELIELLLAATFFLALPASFLRQEHIVVDIIDRAAGPRVGLLKRVAGMTAVVIVAVMSWQGWKAAQDTLLFGDVTSDLELPRIWYWIPVLAGLIGSLIAALLMVLSPPSDNTADRRE